jgi:hypothetical protein
MTGFLLKPASFPRCGFLIRSEMMLVSSMSRVKTCSPAPAPIVDFRKALFQRLHRLEQGDQPALVHGLDYQTVAIAVDDRFIARQFELHGNTERLVTAISE